MIAAHESAAVRRAEAAAMADLPDGALMQRAAAGLATALLRLLAERFGRAYGRRVLLLVGPGSNGGDALWAGARLQRRGVAVQALLTHPAPHRNGSAAFTAAGGRVLDVTGPGGEEAAVACLDGVDVVVDGLLGIGGRPGLSGPGGAVATALRRRPRLGLGLGERPVVVAVDLPSGLAPDGGAITGTHVQADLTVTFGTAKPCLLLPPASHACGEVVVVDIGLDADRLGAAEVERLEARDVARWWPVPGPGDDKYSRGVVGVVAGGATYTGAAVLSTGAAVRSGAGMVRYVGPGAATDLVRASWPEVVPSPSVGAGRVQAWVLGPGVDPDDAGQGDAAEQALWSGVPCLVDAGALAALAREVQSGRSPAGPVLATPHAGELARLLTSLGAGPSAEPVSRAHVEADPGRWAVVAARRTGATVLLKGATTVVASPEGRLRSQPGGPHWLATAGSGDVLAGVAGTLLAAGLGPAEAGALAVLVHARAGGLASAGGPVNAGALLMHLPAAVMALLSGT